MAKKLEEWVASEVRPFRDRPISWISQHHFFRDPIRPSYSDPNFFFAPADGILLYQRQVRADEAIVEIKGRSYSVRDALRDPGYDAPSLVIGTFMTFFDVHINRIPYAGRLTFREEDPLDTYNHPMLDVEKHILDDLRIATNSLEYLHHNQRLINRIDAVDLGLTYYVLQIADYDVDCITPFTVKQNQPVTQGQRFSQIRYGSQVDLIIPLDGRYSFVPVHETGDHVEAGIDPIVEITAQHIPQER